MNTESHGQAQHAVVVNKIPPIVLSSSMPNVNGVSNSAHRWTKLMVKLSCILAAEMESDGGFYIQDRQVSLLLQTPLSQDESWLQLTW